MTLAQSNKDVHLWSVLICEHQFVSQLQFIHSLNVLNKVVFLTLNSSPVLKAIFTAEQRLKKNRAKTFLMEIVVELG